jgi:O-antigen/teichoic acid export membrane protein
VLAAAGAGAASVVIAQVLDAAVTFALYHLLLGWRPSRTFDRQVIREERGFSSWMFTNTTLAWGGKNVDYWVVGRIGDARRLGIYYIAFVLPNIVRQRLTWTITDVLFPVLARMRDDLERYRAAYLRVLRLLLFVGVPVLVGIALLAGDVIELFFGGQWAGAKVPMQILSMAALLELLTQVVTTIFLADGSPRRSAGIEAVRIVTLAAGLAVAVVQESTRVVPFAVLAASAVACATAQVAIGRRLHLRPLMVLDALLPILQPACLMAGVVVVVERTTALPTLGGALLLSAVGAAVYFGTGFVLYGSTYRLLTGESVKLAVPRR